MFIGSVQLVRAVEEHSLAPGSMTQLMMRMARSSVSPLQGLVTTLDTIAGDVDICRGRGW